MLLMLIGICQQIHDLMPSFSIFWRFSFIRFKIYYLFEKKWSCNSKNNYNIVRIIYFITKAPLGYSLIQMVGYCCYHFILKLLLNHVTDLAHVQQQELASQQTSGTTQVTVSPGQTTHQVPNNRVEFVHHNIDMVNHVVTPLPLLAGMLDVPILM